MVEYTATAGVPLPSCLVTNMQGFLYSRRTKQTVTSIVCTIYCRTVYGGLTDETVETEFSEAQDPTLLIVLSCDRSCASSA